MSARSKLGGVGRETLLRTWFLFFAYVWIRFFMAQALWSVAGWNPGGIFRFVWPFEGWLFEGWLFGAGLTFFLILRRSWWAGPIGFLTVGWLAAFFLGRYESRWIGMVTHTIRFVNGSKPSWAEWGGMYFEMAETLVVFAVLIRHVQSRHRILLAFDESEPMPRRRWMPEPSSYYFVTQR